MARSGKAPLYAAFLDLANAPVLVVGGGAVAARKIAMLLQAGARVTVVARECPAAQMAAAKGGIVLVQRAYKSSDLKKQKLVFAATDDPALNRRIADEARRRGIFANVAAPPDAGDLQVPSVVRCGRLSLAISTAGASPALAKALRERLEKWVGPEWSVFAQLLESRRKQVIASISDALQRRRLLQSLGAPRWAEVIRKEGRRRAAAQMDRLIAAAQAKRKHS